MLLSLPILRLAHPTVLQAAVLAAAANGVGAWFATVFAYWNTHYFVFGSAFALDLGPLLLVPLVLIAMARIEEIATIAFGRKPTRLISAAVPSPSESYAPKVSIHVPAYFEPPEMLKLTLDALSRLDYPIRMRGDHQQHARPDFLAAASRITAARLANASFSSTPRRSKASRPAR